MLLALSESQDTNLILTHLITSEAQINPVKAPSHGHREHSNHGDQPPPPPLLSPGRRDQRSVVQQLATFVETRCSRPAGYVSNTLSTDAILMYFSGLCLAVLLPSFVVIKRTRPGLPQNQLWTAMWFVLCAYIHLVVEVRYHSSTRKPTSIPCSSFPGLLCI